MRFEEFELPPLKCDEILARIVSDSVCMSSYKAVVQGGDHKRVPKDIDKNPIIIGHELCGEIVEVGAKWRHKFEAGRKFSLQPALNLKDDPFKTPGYSYRYFGGNATYVIIPNEVMEQGCILDYSKDAYFYASLAEPMSCIIGSFRTNYHTVKGSYAHQMGTVKGGNLAILAGAGPMGLGAIDYAIHCENRPGVLVITDIDESRLARASSIYTAEGAAKNGIELHYVNTKDMQSTKEYLISLTGGKGYDDVFVFAPVRQVVELADELLAKDGCLNFFAGPIDTGFSAELNYYNVHYNMTHVVGASGGNTDDLIEALRLMEQGMIDPSSMITHIGGLNCVVDTVLNLPAIPGGKKMIYNNISMELTAIVDFKEKGACDPLFLELSNIVEKNNGMWCAEAEKFLLANSAPI